MGFFLMAFDNNLSYIGQSEVYIQTTQILTWIHQFDLELIV